MDEFEEKLQNIENELLRVETQHGHICRMLLKLKKEYEKLKKEIKRGTNNKHN